MAEINNLHEGDEQTCMKEINNRILTRRCGASSYGRETICEVVIMEINCMCEVLKLVMSEM